MDPQKISLSIVLFLSTLLISGDGWERTLQSIFTDSGQELTSIRGNNSQDVALGDIDGDGDVDAVVAQGGVSSPEENIIWLNDGQASFSESDQFVGGNDSRSVALGDLDGDEDLDLFIANAGSPIPFDDEIWINQGGGIFSNTQTLASGESRLVELGDLDGDTDLDALVAGSGQQQIWWNDGGGSFSQGPTLGHPNPYDFALGDLDNDSDLDIVMAGEGDFIPNQIFWNEWETSGDFPAGPELVNEGISSGVELAHLDDDGDLDIYFASSQANVVWWNDGDGTFSTGSGMGNEDDSDVALGDLDGDGDVDAFVTRSKTGDNANGVWLNNGDRTFTASSDALGNFTSIRAELADLDGDGELDAFVANSGPNKVWLNERGGPDDGQTGLFSASDQDLGTASVLALGDLDTDGDLDAVFVNKILLNGEDGDPPGVFSVGQMLSGGGAGADLGDVDGDGDLDIFFVGVSNQVWLNGEGDNPPGEFSLGQSGFGSYSSHVVLDDLDGDGDLDAFIAAGEHNEIMEVWLNVNDEGGNPTGTFSLWQNFDLDDVAIPVTFDVEDVDLGDLDGDGDVDAVVVGTRRLVLLNGEGSDPQGTFSAGEFLVSKFLSLQDRGVALGDLNGDGSLDIFVVGWFPNKIYMNGLSGEEGTFTDLGEKFLDINNNDVALGDLDNDGDLDAFITTGEEQVRSRSNQIWENGGLNLEEQCLGSELSKNVVLGDLDGDGDLDAMVLNSGIGTVIWINGQGTFCSCIVADLYGEDEALAVSRSHALGGSSPFALISQIAELQTYLDVRDELLIRTRTGQGYARLYDQSNAEIYALLVADSTLRSEGLAALNLWAPHLQALLDGQGDGAIITADQVGAVEDFLAHLSAAASPELQAVISAELAKLPPLGDFVGMSMEEARAIVLNDTIFLPLVQ